MERQFGVNLSYFKHGAHLKVKNRVGFLLFYRISSTFYLCIFTAYEVKKMQTL